MGNLSSTTMRATNGNLGLVPPSAGNTQLKIGVCSAGTENMIYAITSKQQLVENLGTGPLVDAAALLLDTPGHGTLLCMRAHASTPGSAGSVTRVDPSSAAGTPATVGGISFTALQRGVRVRIVVAGNNTTLSVSASGKDVTVTSATDGMGAATSTGADILAAINAAAAVAALLTCATGNTACSAAAYTALSFGSTLACSVSGAPLDAYQVRVKFTIAGALGTSAFKLSLDGGDVYGDTTATPGGGVYSVPGTGLTLTFTGTAAVGDGFNFDCTAPSYSLSDLTAAMTAAKLDWRSFAWVHVVGQIARADIATVFAGVGSLADSFETAGKYIRVVLEGAGNEGGESNAAWSAAWIAATTALSHPRMAIILGEGETFSPLLQPQAGRTMRRSVAHAVMALRSSLTSGTDPNDQSLPALLPGLSKLYHDDQADTLVGARFTVAYTEIDVTGYLCEARLFDSPTGDFRFWQYGAVLDQAMRTARAHMRRYQSAGPRVRKVANGNYPAGSIDPVDALAMEQKATQVLREDLGVRAGSQARGECTDVTLTVDRTVNLIQSNNLPYNVQVLPLGYTKTLTGTAGLVNPALKVS